LDLTLVEGFNYKKFNLNTLAMNFKNLIFSFVAAALLFNCSNNSNDDLIPTPDPDPTIITYDGTVKAIIDNNCTQCHGSPTSNGAPISFITYTQVKNGVDNIISRMNNTTNPMPQSGLLPLATRNLIQQWKDDGLLEN
jgi:hypothetical protein